MTRERVDFNPDWVKTISKDDFVAYGLHHHPAFSDTDLEGIYNSIVPHTDEPEMVIPYHNLDEE